MKFLLPLFFIFFSSYSYSQENIDLPDASNHIDDIIHQKLTLIKPTIFLSDIETIDTIIKSTKKKYKIVYLFSAKCHSSAELFPQITKFVNDHSLEFVLFPIIGHKYKEIPVFKDYLNRNHYYKPVYILNMGKYGKKRNPFKRLDQLTKTLCKECDYEKMGFSSFFVIDENNKVIVHNNWNFSGKDKLNQLQELVKKHKVKNAKNIFN